MKSETYWKKRSEQRILEAERQTAPYLRKINAIYRKAADDLQKDIARIFRTFQRDYTQSEAEAFLRESIPMAEYNRLKSMLPQIQDETYRKDLEMRLNAQSYRYRIDRKQYLRQTILTRLSRAADQEKAISTVLYQKTAEDGYLKTMYDLQQGIGVGFSFVGLPDKAVNRMLSSRWYGRNYSASIWRNRGIVARAAEEVLEKGLLSGQSVRKMSKELAQKVYSHSMSNATRLIRTEVNYFHNQAAYESYKDADLDEYEFLATLDLRTSEICRSLDRKVFPMADAKVGKNYPPMHPYCRSTVLPVIDVPGLEKLNRRAARDLSTGKTVNIDDMDYGEWKKRFVTGGKFSDAWIEAVQVTEEAIAAVPLVTPKGWSKPAAETLQRENRAILRAVMGKAPGTEAGRTYTMDMKPLSELIIGKKGENSVRLPFHSEPYVTIHNHPDGQIFSHTDIAQFVHVGNLQTMSIVTNFGNTFVLSKTDDYDGFSVGIAWDNYESKFEAAIQEQNFSKYIKEISSLLKEIEKYGTQIIQGAD